MNSSNGLVDLVLRNLGGQMVIRLLQANSLFPLIDGKPNVYSENYKIKERIKKI